MARRKESSFKQRLSKALKINRRVPIWVVLRTRNRGLLRPRRRHWRRDKLKLRTKHAKKEERRLKSIAKRRRKTAHG